MRPAPRVQRVSHPLLTTAQGRAETRERIAMLAPWMIDAIEREERERARRAIENERREWIHIPLTDRPHNYEGHVPSIEEERT